MPAKVKAFMLVGSFLCSLGVAAQSSQGKRTRDDCSVYDAPPTEEGRIVTIRAVYAPTPFEGDYLVDAECKKGMWFTNPATAAFFAAILTGRSHAKVQGPIFELIKDKQYDRFVQFAYARTPTLEPEWKVTATFKGRLDRSKDFTLDNRGFGNGFGQMNASEYQFVLLSVSDVDAEPVPPFGPKPSYTSVPDQISDEQ